MSSEELPQQGLKPYGVVTQRSRYSSSSLQPQQAPAFQTEYLANTEVIFPIDSVEGPLRKGWSLQEATYSVRLNGAGNSKHFLFLWTPICMSGEEQPSPCLPAQLLTTAVLTVAKGQEKFSIVSSVLWQQSYTMRKGNLWKAFLSCHLPAFQF